MNNEAETANPSTYQQAREPQKPNGEDTYRTPSHLDMPGNVAPVSEINESPSETVTRQAKQLFEKVKYEAQTSPFKTAAIAGTGLFVLKKLFGR